jgi:glycosyltransferase involved in cell wall biosynthesis
MTVPSGAAGPPPRFSVVIAAYNAAAWIATSVQSALRQTRPAEEVIVVGDGCTDGTGDVIAARFGDAVRWTNLARNSGGQSAPNNEGIRLSRGTHVAYLGHDDVWSPRHLERLAGVIEARNPDVAVSGAVYHGPPGSRLYQITGRFDDPRVASREFFPPSSFAHRRDVVDRIGPWRDPASIRAPADCDFLLRAVEAGCAFASTNAITVHKFAAGHRYLSYRLPAGAEQARMLERLGTPDGEASVLAESDADIAKGADCAPVRYLDFDAYAPGELYRRNLATKGLRATAPVLVDAPRRFDVDDGPAGLDWHALERHPRLGPFRWSGPNPHPRYLVPARVAGPYVLRVRILAFAEPPLAKSLTLEVDGREAAFVAEAAGDGTTVLAVGPIEGRGDDGIVVGFHLPRCGRLWRDPQQKRAGLALAGIEVVPLAPPSLTTRTG